MEILEMNEECNKVRCEKYVSEAVELISAVDVEHFGALDEAFIYCRKNMSKSEDYFINNYLFGGCFYAYCAGRMPSMPISDVFNYLTAKKKLYLSSLD